MENNQEKLTKKEKLGYASASAGDSISYTLIGSFLMFFLTTVAGVDPVTAGMLTGIGAIWNAIFNPLMGYLADSFNSRFGRRRPLILAGSVPLAVVTFLLFTRVDLPVSVKPFYYGIMLMLYWTCYTGFMVPYLALGVDYTEDYDERTVLRLYASLFNLIGALASMSAPTILVARLTASGMDLGHAWSLTGGLLGGLSLLSVVVTVLASGKKDPGRSAAIKAGTGASGAPATASAGTEKKRFSPVAIIKEYVSVARLKPVFWLVIASTAFLIGFTMLLSDMMYYYTYVLGFSAAQISLVLLIRPLGGALLIPVTAKLILHFDKRQAIIILYLIGAGLLIIARLLGAHYPVDLILFIAGSILCSCLYWQVFPGIYYDVCEYDHWVTGRNRKATIVSFQGLVEAIAAGIGTFLLGFLLGRAGFDGELAVQSASALCRILDCATIVPVGFFLLGTFATWKYPLTKKRYNQIRRDLASRKRETPENAE